ncbi:MAG: 4-hydroxy-tetrahydrodipicolinate synthase [Candidatus Lokiarchaeota archaeon]|nr:4-hydroxy-tetrahydrodipicolinate synthase [Candidatus Lokiarchaeota archaeon]
MVNRLKLLKNTFTALISPMDRDGDLDKKQYRTFIRSQIEAGCGLVPCGTTGESATMSHQEHESVVRWCVDEANQSSKKPFVLAGAGSNSTREATSLSVHVESLGVDGILSVTPYYNKPTQQGLFEHYSAIARSVDVPIVIYNVPGRTGCNILPETVAKLAIKFDNIKGYKAASGNLDQIIQVIEQTPDDFIVMSGDDGKTYDIMKMGGKGVISVASNIIPKQMIEFTKLIEDNKWELALRMNDKLQPLFSTLFIESNPGPVKYAAELLGIMDRTLRLPLVPPTEQSQTAIRKVLMDLELIK